MNDEQPATHQTAEPVACPIGIAPEASMFCSAGYCDVCVARRAATPQQPAAASAGAVLPEPLTYIAQFHGEWRETITSIGEPVYSEAQMRAALQSPPVATAQQSEAPRWISVDDRLPAPDSGEVLVWIARPTWSAEPYAGVDQWVELHEDPTGMGGPTMPTGCGWSDNEFDDVSHWMPLPEAPSPAHPAAGEATEQM